jgi:site-specific DNA recombinase
MRFSAHTAIEGRLPHGIGVAALRDAPAEWSRQYERLGLINSPGSAEGSR